jgi:hypothetical protein
MDIVTLNRLRELRETYSIGVFGKIAQKLLALALRRMEFTHVVERGVEGVDIDIARGDRDKYALEVKTTEGRSFVLSESNVSALGDRAKDGYRPVIAALRLAVFERWILAEVPLDELCAGTILVEALRAYRMKSCEASLAPVFQHVVETHLSGTIKGGLQYLTEQLAREGVEVRDS